MQKLDSVSIVSFALDKSEKYHKSGIEISKGLEPLKPVLADTSQLSSS